MTLLALVIAWLLASAALAWLLTRQETEPQPRPAPAPDPVADEVDRWMHQWDRGRA